jgi:hypothetical protein
MPVRSGGFLCVVCFALVIGCSLSPEIAAREAAQPTAIAAAICAQYRPEDIASCDRVELADPSSKIAYAGCLEYNRLDLKPCAALRVAYESALHAYFDATGPRTVDKGPALAEPRLSSSRIRDLRRTAEELYKASNSDADTFEAALLIPEIRRKIEAALRQPLTDAQLRALVSKTRAEAVYWYTYTQGKRRAATAARGA